MATHLETRFAVTINDVDGVSSGGTVTNERPRISGTAEPFSTIDVHDGTALLGVVSANGEGSWSLQLSTPLFDGVHDFSAEQARGPGMENAVSYFPVTVAALEVSGNAVWDEPGQPAAAHDTTTGAPFFPPNLFTSHTTPTGTDTLETERNAPAVDDPQAYSRQPSAHAESGKPFDMVAFLGDHLVLDLSAVTDRSINAHSPAIGGFDLGGQHNALKLSLVDVLNVGQDDLFIDDGKHQLIVNGKDGDSVDLTNSHVPGFTDGNWEHHGTAEVGGVVYNVVEHTTANTELLVEQAVQIHMH